MKAFKITAPDLAISNVVRHKIDTKTKPIGSLGLLETVAEQICLIQQTATPRIQNPHIVVFAADHGLAQEGVSAYPQEVTQQMVLNFLRGGAAISVFCNQHNIQLRIVDAGVKQDVNTQSPIFLNRKTRNGTSNMLHEPAMTVKEGEKCIEWGAAIVQQLASNGCNTIGFGEMGIGNTSSASLLTSIFCNEPIDRCVGHGTGLNADGVKKKKEILKKVLELRGNQNTVFETLVTFGGFEIVQMAGAMLQSAELKMLILVDGFIATAAFLAAHALYPEVLNYAVFCHQSDEAGHAIGLKHLNVQPLLSLRMRLGEGTGAAVAFPLVQSATLFMNQMASFEQAGVSGKAVT